MKKKIVKFISFAIALVISTLGVVFSATGCGLIVRDYARANARTITTISEFTQNVYINRRAVLRADGSHAFLEFTEFGADDRAIKAREVTQFGDPVYPEVVFDIFTGQQINLLNDPSLPRWPTPLLQQENRDRIFAFERDAHGNMLRTSLEQRAAATLREEIIPIEFTSPQIRIYQAQLVNHFHQFAGQFLNQGMTVEEAVDQIMGILINQELVIIEADKHFFVGNLYWTEEDVDHIQRSVYATIDAQILRHMNIILERNGLPHLLTPNPAPPEGSQPSLPTRPEPEEERVISPRIHSNRDRNAQGYDLHDNGTPIIRSEYRWQDGWYLNDSWFLHGDWDPYFTRINGQYVGAFEANPNYIAGFPGMHGDADRRSLSREALNAFLEEMLDSAQHIIGLSDYNVNMDDRQRGYIATLAEEAEFLRHVRDTKGIEFIYPLMGNTLTFKLLVGAQSIQQSKLEKLQVYVTNIVQVNDNDIVSEYQNRLQNQRLRFGGINNIPVNRHGFSAAIDAGELILWTPTNRYLWVKHILLPFGDAEEARLENFDRRNRHLPEAIRRARREEYRAQLAAEMNVYRNIDGERDFARPFRSNDVVAYIYDNMRHHRNNPQMAEETFHDLIFDWNNDPGIFNNRIGYRVIYRLANDDTEQYMQEFADAAREFRTRRFGLGQLLTDENGAPQLAITDFGIHIMFYAADPFYFNNQGEWAHGVKTLSLNCYTTPGRHESVRDVIRRELLEQRRNAFYANWEADYIVRMRRRRLNEDTMLVLIDNRSIDDLTQRWHQEIFGR
ncbi:MAG: hypothetical protein FWE03_07280 [Firmicutes bacterium]|nr:hypothetical protein [Bacillota bacterium]